MQLRTRWKASAHVKTRRKCKTCLEAGRHDQVEPKSRAGTPNMQIHMHGIAAHTNMAGHTQRHVSTDSADTKPQDSLTGSTRPCPDETDGVGSRSGMLRTCIHAQGNTGNSNRPENMSAMPNLPARGTKPRMGEREQPRDETNPSDMHTRMQSVVSDSNTPANTSVMSKTPDLPARCVELHVDQPKRFTTQTDACTTCRGLRRTR